MLTQEDVDDAMDMLAHEDMPDVDDEERSMSFVPRVVFRYFVPYQDPPPPAVIFPSTTAMRRLMHMR
jgi:hypothetical protein